MGLESGIFKQVGVNPHGQVSLDDRGSFQMEGISLPLLGPQKKHFEVIWAPPFTGQILNTVLSSHLETSVSGRTGRKIETPLKYRCKTEPPGILYLPRYLTFPVQRSSDEHSSLL